MTKNFEIFRPENSVWVEASAGSGKTFFLVSRLLALLLSGVEASKILCITFTRAAAGEIEQRVMSKISEFSTLADADVTVELARLGLATDQKMLARAKNLYWLMMESNQAVAVHTIHSLSQKLLDKYVDDMGTNAFATLALDGQVIDLKEKAYKKIITAASSGTEAELSESVALISRYFSLGWLNKFLFTYTADQPMESSRHNRPIDWENEVRRFASLESLRLSLDMFQEMKKNLEDIASFRNNPSVYWRKLSKLFLNAEDDIRVKETYTKNDFFIEAAEHYRDLLIKRNLFINAAVTRAAGVIYAHWRHEYQKLKKDMNVRDYDDLIAMAKAMLCGGNRSESVRYDMDKDIHHILLDEAQDTSDAQWRIVRAMADDFVINATYQRSLMVVGDAKQSIYSFQGARPKLFRHHQSELRQLWREHQLGWYEHKLENNFRSSPLILRAVDKVFEHKKNYLGKEAGEVQHFPVKKNDGAKIELWPIVFDKKPKREEWTLPGMEVDEAYAAQILAEQVADKIAHMLSAEVPLINTARPVRPDDILILLRTRDPLMPLLAKELKRRHIPVNGCDRIELQKNQAVLDLIFAATFALNPLDDYNLACLLKSAFINFSEDDLFVCCYGREGNLWPMVCEKTPQNILAWLNDVRNAACCKRPDEFFYHLLYQPCPAAESGLAALRQWAGYDVDDVMAEFLNVLGREFSKSDTGLETFVHQFMKATYDVKRDLAEKKGDVRLLTVHASKGLQAPIVFLLDKATTPRLKNTLQYGFDRDGFYLVAPGHASPDPRWQAIKKNLQQETDEEYYRLLYVALTRAEEQLIVASWSGSKPEDDCWHNVCYAAWRDMKNDLAPADDEKIILHEPAKHVGVSESVKEEKIIAHDFAAPLSSLQAESAQTQKKRVTESENVSPPDPYDSGVAGAARAHALERGNIIHALLQVLPERPESEWPEWVLKIVGEGVAHSSLVRDCLEEAAAVIKSPHLRPIFDVPALVEREIIGDAEGIAWIGKIDRLVCVEDTLWMIDYKTDRAVPRFGSDAPEKYRLQLHRYATLLQQVFPQQPIRQFLLYTANATLLEVNGQGLDFRIDRANIG